MSATMTGAQAQSAITPDTTLGGESSVVTRDVLIRGILSDRIDGGAQRGANLFHSFQQFNVSAGRGAYFATINPEIANIIARVTGSSRSEILGTLGTLSNQPVNLFFINPNGILFGPQATLDISGSFLATTASALQFGDLGAFSAGTREPPSALLTVDPTALFFNQLTAGRIVNQSVSPIAGGLFPVGLRVPNGQTLTLVGGDVQVEQGGRLSAFGGRVEVGSVAGLGIVQLGSDGRLRFPDDLGRGNVTLSEFSVIDVSLNDGGGVGITAGDISLLDNSQILGGIFSGLGAEDSRAGNLTLNALGTLRLAGGSSLENNVGSNAIGTAGDIEVAANQILLTEGAQITASTLGRGNAGNVLLQVGDRLLLDGARTAIFSSVEENAVGNGGRLGIETGSLVLSNGAQLIASTSGRGDAGNIEIRARDGILLTGARTIIFSEVRPGAVGNGGTLQIEANTFTLAEDAALTASNVLAEGNAGQIILRVRDRISIKNGPIFANTISSVAGQGGNILLEAGSLFMSNEPGRRNLVNLGALTAGRGDAGNITIRVRDRMVLDNSSILTGVNEDAEGNGGTIRITTDSLVLRNRSQIGPATLGQGNAGNVVIRARDRVVLRGGSSMLSVVGPLATGQGGNIQLSTGALLLGTGSLLASSTLGQGDAGDVIVRARDRVVLGNESRIFTNVEPRGIGQGGSLNIRTNSLFLSNGAQLIANTLGQGNAGNIQVTATGTVRLQGINQETGRSTAFLANTTEGAGGRGGSIVVRADRLQVQDAAVIFAQSRNNRRGGNVQLRVNQFNATGGGQVIANATRRGRAGNIVLDAGQIQLSGRDTTLASRREKFGTAVANVGNGESGLFADTQPNSRGQGGSITVRGGSLQLSDRATISAQTAGRGDAGDINIAIRGGTQLSNSNITAAGRFAAGGSITLRTSSLNLTGNAAITAENTGGRTAGNITLNVGDRTLLSNSNITAASRREAGGNITLNTGSLFLTERAAVTAESTGRGAAGNIRVNVGDRFQMRDSAITTQAPNSAGGDIVINGDRALSSIILLEGDSDITTNSRGNGGNITIGGAGVVAFDDSDIISRSQDSRGGNITLSPFFSETNPLGRADNFDGNNQVDLNASGRAASGQITTPDTSGIQNSLTPLADASVDEGRLLANSCVVRDRRSGRFIITGADGLPQRPGNNSFPSFPTGDVQPLPEATPEPLPQSRFWQPGDPIVEPDGVYELADGRLVMSRECGT
ncbi:two-partner secretion domain-containing protein [Thermoleptolyngbya sp.]